ncbi:MAG: hypothetical protein M1818_004843 [Claussenomyces sp. TS43310]|nr:MAG: hypothetical protein M1818_004843 [Claussenomyces sp. TS43310]
MAQNKRSYDHSSEETGSQKRQRMSKQPNRIDPTYGQRYAIPGLDGDGSHDSDDVDQSLDPEALRYLMSVRTEAASIPTVLVAPQEKDDRSIYDCAVGDARGYYQDGAYTAAPLQSLDSLSLPLDNPGGIDPQHAYHNSILARFTTLRAKLQATPPRSAVERLSGDHVSYMGATASEWKSWRRRVTRTDAAAAQLAGMGKGTALRVLRLMTRELGKRDGLQGTPRCGKRLSRWAWGLLARLPERGEMSSEEIGVVRELAKRAVWVSVALKGIHHLEALSEDSEGDDEEKGVDSKIDNGEEDDHSDHLEEEDQLTASFSPSADAAGNRTLADTDSDGKLQLNIEGQEDLEAARARLLANISPQVYVAGDEVETDGDQELTKQSLNRSPEVEEQSEENSVQNTWATVDMIITIAGEMYGQRDLLEFREEWD